MSGNKLIVLDTSALIELFDGTQKGKTVEEAITGAERIFIPAIVVAELVSKLKRKKSDYVVFVKKLETGAELLSLDAEIAKKAGELHGELKKNAPNISLADCVIMAHGEREGACVITCDNHFKHYEKSIIL